MENACEETPETAQALVFAAGLSMPQNSLTLVTDESGVYYRVPISCINDPNSYCVDAKSKKKEIPSEKVLTVNKLYSSNQYAI